MWEDGQEETVRHGSVVIAAITSCTNTSNPSVMIAAGLVAKKAVERGLTVRKHVKTSLAPGSKVVTEYLNRSGLTSYLDTLGFNLVGYGCTTCIGNSGPLPEPVTKAIRDGELVAASVLSGNRNFEGRVHQHVKANFLASPPLVVAYALAGTVDLDLSTQPIGKDRDGSPVYLKDLWPSNEEIRAVVADALRPELFLSEYKNIEEGNAEWNGIAVESGNLYPWDVESTYIREPPFFATFRARNRACLPSKTPGCWWLSGTARRPTTSARPVRSRPIAPLENIWWRKGFFKRISTLTEVVEGMMKS